MMIHALVLRIRVQPGANLAYLTDALGECARELEADESVAVRTDRGTTLGLVPDEDDPGRYAWEIVAESYPGIGEA